jgi:hypothetical protein
MVIFLSYLGSLNWILGNILSSIRPTQAAHGHSNLITTGLALLVFRSRVREMLLLLFWHARSVMAVMAASRLRRTRRRRGLRGLLNVVDLTLQQSSERARTGSLVDPGRPCGWVDSGSGWTLTLRSVSSIEDRGEGSVTEQVERRGIPETTDKTDVRREEGGGRSVL